LFLTLLDCLCRRSVGSTIATNDGLPESPNSPQDALLFLGPLKLVTELWSLAHANVGGLRLPNSDRAADNPGWTREWVDAAFEAQ